MNVETYYCKRHRSIADLPADKRCKWAGTVGAPVTDWCDIVPCRIRGRRQQ